MNVIGIIILAALLLDLTVNVLADFLNLKTLRTDLPEEFRGIYEAHRYRRSQEYLKANTRFGWVANGVNFLVLLLFWFSGGFPILDAWVRSWQLGPVASGLIYIGVLSLLAAAISLPFGVYAIFVIEERFGFNRTSWSTFIKDKAKGLGLALVLGGPLLFAILGFFEYAGAGGWLFCWIVVTFYLLVVQFVAPNWIMPLFNRFTPLEDGELKESILAYARSINFPVTNIQVMDGSRRSNKTNAFFTGFGRNKRIVLFDTLIRHHTVSELVTVLAHEMGHYKLKHILKSMLMAIGQTGIMLFLFSVFISYEGLFEAFFMHRPSVYAGLIFFVLLYAPLDFITGLVSRKLSRRNEYAADRFAAQTTRDPAAMISALKKLSVHNLANLSPHPFYVFLNYSHPPVLRRIEALQNLRTDTPGLSKSS